MKMVKVVSGITSISRKYPYCAELGVQSIGAVGYFQHNCAKA